MTFVNIQAEEVLTPAAYLGQTFSEDNKVNIKDYNYSPNLNFNGFRGSGIIVLNLIAGSFSNQFTSVQFTMGKNVTLPPPTPTLSLLQGNDTTRIAFINSQMHALAANSNNDIQIQGKQNAIATVQGTPDVQGICAITFPAASITW